MGRIISIHEYDLKPGISAEQFEQVFREAEARGLLQLPGLVAHHFVKGAKGVRCGAYAAVPSGWTCWRVRAVGPGYA